MRGNSVIILIGGGREPNTFNVTHTATIKLSCAIFTAMANKPVALNHHQLTEANADDRYAQEEKHQKATDTLLHTALAN